jgi:hypothetical protein
MSIFSCCVCTPCCQKSDIQKPEIYESSSTQGSFQLKSESSKTTTLFHTTLHSQDSGPPKDTSSPISQPPISPTVLHESLQKPKAPIHQNFFSDFTHPLSKLIKSSIQEDIKPKDQVSSKQPSKSFSRTSNSQNSNTPSFSSQLSKYQAPPSVSPLHFSKLQLKTENLVHSFSHLSLSSATHKTTENIPLLFFKTFEKLCAQGFTQELAALITEYTVVGWDEDFKKHRIKLQKTELLEILQNAPILTKYLTQVECAATDILDHDFTYFNQLSHLSALFLTSCRHLSPVCLSYLQKLENLSTLSLEDCSHFLETSQGKGTQLTFEAEQNISILQRANPHLSTISITEMRDKKAPYKKEEALRLTLSINNHF